MGKDRLCINPDLVKASGGRTTCPVLFDSIRENGCGGCPKAGGFNSGIDRPPVPDSERIADEVITRIKESGIRAAAKRDGRNYWRI